MSRLVFSMAIDNTRLRYGPYRTPHARIGRTVTCLARGKVKIWSLSDGRIQWPVGKSGSALSLVLYGDLAKAVRREAAVAVRYWWGVSGSTILKWRRALGIRLTEGDRALRREYMTPAHNRLMTTAATAVAALPERRRKIAESRLGKSPSSTVIAKLRKANLGKKLPETVRKRMSQSHLARGTQAPAAGVPWSEDELRVLRSFRPIEVARKTGRSLRGVYAARRRLRDQDQEASESDSLLPELAVTEDLLGPSQGPPGPTCCLDCDPCAEKCEN